MRRHKQFGTYIDAYMNAYVYMLVRAFIHVGVTFINTHIYMTYILIYTYKHSYMQGIIPMLTSAFCAHTCPYELNTKQHIHTTNHSSDDIHRKKDREIETERACLCVSMRKRARTREWEKERGSERAIEGAREREEARERQGEGEERGRERGRESERACVCVRVRLFERGSSIVNRLAKIHKLMKFRVATMHTMP